MNLKELIKFGMEESQEPVIKNPILREALEPRTMDQASLKDDLEPGPLKDELLKDFDPSQETHEEYLQRINLERPFNMNQGGRIGFKKKGFVSGTGTGVKGIDDPEKYKIVKKYLNKVKSQKNKRIFLDWSEQIGNKKTKWYTDLSQEVQLSRDPLNKLINKVTLEEFPTAYAGKSGRVNYAREMVVKSFIDYWNQNGAFDGNEKLSDVLKQFQKDSVDKRFENINRYFMDWKDGKFEVSGVDKKNLDKNLLKDIKNYKPNAKDKRSLLVAKQLKYLDGLSPNLSFNQVEKLFAKQFPDNAQTLQHRLNQLTQLKRNGAYNTGAGNVAKIATIKTGDRPKWLIEGYGRGFTGNYGKLIKKADDLLAAGESKFANRLYKAADKFFSPNGIFTKAAGEGEHPLSRNMGDGPIGNQLKINSLVSGDLNQFKKFNFDSPVRNAVLEYNNPKTTDARRAELKIEIENRKKLMNILTEGPNQKGIVESVKFNYGPKELTASVDVIDIDKVKNFDINEYIARGEDYRKSFVAKGEKLGLIDESGNIIKQTLSKKQQHKFLKQAGFNIDECLSSGGRVKLKSGKGVNTCIRGVIEKEQAKALQGNKISKAKFGKFGKAARTAGWFLGPIDIPIELAFALPHMLAGDKEAAKRATTLGLFGWGESKMDEVKAGSPESYKYAKHMKDNEDYVDAYFSALDASENLDKLKNLPEHAQKERKFIYNDQFSKAQEKMASIQEGYVGYDDVWEEAKGKSTLQDYLREDVKKKADAGLTITDIPFLGDYNMAPYKGGDPITNLKQYLEQKGERYWKSGLEHAAEEAGVADLYDTFMQGADNKDPRDLYSELPLEYASELAALEKQEMLEGLKRKGKFMTRGFKDMLEAQGIDWTEAYDTGRAEGGIASSIKK